MISNSSARSPSSTPQRAEIDPEALERGLRLMQVVPPELLPPAVRRAFDELVDAAARLLIKLHDLGRLRIACTADGEIRAELLDRRLQ
jgi:hypothetical protein